MTDTDLPVVIARKAPKGSLSHVLVDCPFCKKVHGHGYGKTGQDGPRRADCGGGDYWLKFEPQ